MKSRKKILESIGTDVKYQIKKLDAMNVPTGRIADLVGLPEYYVLIVLGKN